MNVQEHLFYQGEINGKHFFCITVEDRMQRIRQASLNQLEQMLVHDHLLQPPLQQTVRLAAEGRARRLHRQALAQEKKQLITYLKADNL